MATKVIAKREIKPATLLFESEVRNDILNLLKVLLQELKIWKESKGKYKELELDDFYKDLIVWISKVRVHGFHEMKPEVKKELGYQVEEVKKLNRELILLEPFLDLTKEFGAVYTPQIPKQEKYELTKGLVSTREQAIKTVVSQLIEHMHERDALFPIPVIFKQLLNVQRENKKLTE